MRSSSASEERKAAPAKKRDEIVYDALNERVVVGAAMVLDRDQRRALVRSIAADEMLVPENAAMWRAHRVLVDQNLDYDPEVFRRIVADEGTPVAEEYVRGIEEAAGVPGNLDWHVATLRWDATRARVVQGSLPELLTRIKDPKASPDVVAAAARGVLRGLEGGGGRRFIRRGDELSRTYKADVDARVKQGNFYPFGHEALDSLLSEGAMPKRTGLIAGLSGSGKSTVVAELIRALAVGGRRVLYGAWEMGSESSLDVMVAQMARIPIVRIVQGDLAPEEVMRVGRCVDWLTSRIVFMDNAFFGDDVRGRGPGRKTNERSLDVLEGYVAESGCDVVVMDLWERCLVDLTYEGVTTALYRQQEMHARYNVYGVIVQQLLLKDVEKRSDKRPTRDSIKGTAAYVEVPDQIFGVHRDAQFKRVPDDSLELICLKQRKGKPNWAVRYDWDAEMGLVTNGCEVEYDPGLESSGQFGDIGDIDPRTRRGGRGGGSRGGRRGQ